MQKKRKNSAIVLFLMTATIAIQLVLVGCGDSGGGDGDNGNGTNTPAKFIPEKPLITNSHTGFELVNVDLKTVTETEANNPDNQSAVVAFTWAGEGAISYNVYWSEENSRPVTPGATRLTNPVYFARNLKPETEYNFWVEAVNPNGTTVSDPLTKTTGKKGPQASGGLERGDYPRKMRVVPGDESLTVSWSLSDRVGWYEVYYAPVGTIPRADISATKIFKWDSTAGDLPQGAVAVDVSGSPNASRVAYKSSGNPGYTSEIPVYRPDTGLWTGYWFGAADGVDGDTRPVLGINSAATFAMLEESWLEGTLGRLRDPYSPLDPLFANAIPWDGTKAGTPGTPTKFFENSVTITGLENGKTYEVWVRSPNANGERGYSYITGTPGTGDAIAAPSTVQVFTPSNTTRDLIVYWSKVTGAENYRIYASKFDYTPNATMSYALAAGSTDSVYTLSAMESNTTYYVWVVAEKDGMPGLFGTPVTGKTGTAPSAGKVGDKIIAGTNQKVKIGVYIEVNDHNPLNAGSYILEDGTYLFDYVILFAANIRNRNRNGTGTEDPYVHLNENVQYLLSNNTKYIKPLQDKGIKVVLGLLGDHDGVSFGSMNDTDRTAFANDVKRVLDLYQLDGVDFDDEWASKEDWDNWGNDGLAGGTPGKVYDTISPNSIWTYPISSWGWPTSATVYRNPAMGIVPGNGTFTAPTQEEMTMMWLESGESYYKTILKTREVLGPDKIISLYEFNTGRYITPGGAANGVAAKDGLSGAIDYALQPWYNQYYANSANDLPRSVYSPFGMDLSGKAYAAQSGAPNPPIAISNNEMASDTVYDYATRYKNAATEGSAYNVLYFYGLEPASNLLKYVSSDSRASVTKEEYISRATSIIFGQDCILTAEGGDYRKDW
ncbi:MAG: hypothetical protein LBH75_03860 [Treponema sp.]|jgi:hypothetical protein|nr:hypothetical protein [Treponema sp.]